MKAGEASSAFFLRLEKKQAADQFVAALRADDGSIVSHTDDLCLFFWGPFTRPCHCWSYRSRYSASYTSLTHLTRKQTTKTVQPTKHATADKRTIARSTVTAFNLQSFIEPPSHGTTITPLKHTLDSQNTNFKTRRRNHIASFRHAKHKNFTDLSKHIWTLKNDNIDYSISWRV